MAEKTKIILELPNGQKQELVLDAVLFGGIMGDETGFPVGGYNGDLGLDKTITSLVHIMRASIKIMEEQGELPRMVAKETLEFCMNEALKREEDNDPLDNVDLDTHMLKIRKDNQ